MNVNVIDSLNVRIELDNVCELGREEGEIFRDYFFTRLDELSLKYEFGQSDVFLNGTVHVGDYDFSFVEELLIDLLREDPYVVSYVVA